MDNVCTPVRHDALVVENYSLFNLACVLTGDPAQAAILMRDALESGRTCLGGDRAVIALDLARELARRVYLAWCQGKASTPAPVTPLQGGFRSLTEEQRSVVALCAYGAHTYSQASTVLDMETLRVVDLMHDALCRLDLELSGPNQMVESMAREDLLQDAPAV